jgi:hypothetical protein
MDKTPPPRPDKPDPDFEKPPYYLASFDPATGFKHVSYMTEEQAEAMRQNLDQVTAQMQQNLIQQQLSQATGISTGLLGSAASTAMTHVVGHHPWHPVRPHPSNPLAGRGSPTEQRYGYVIRDYDRNLADPNL